MRGPGQEDPDVVAARAFLERLIRSAGYNLQDVDARLGFTRGWVGRIIHGDINLGYHHILRILDAIGVDRYLFFSTLHPAPGPRRAPAPPPSFYEETRALAERVLRRLPEVDEPAPAAPVAVSDDDLEARVNRAIRTVLSRLPAADSSGRSE